MQPRSGSGWLELIQNEMEATAGCRAGEEEEYSYVPLITKIIFKQLLLLTPRLCRFKKKKKRLTLKTGLFQGSFFILLWTCWKEGNWLPFYFKEYTMEAQILHTDLQTELTALREDSSGLLHDTGSTQDWHKGSHILEKKPCCNFKWLLIN